MEGSAVYKAERDCKLEDPTCQYYFPEGGEGSTVHLIKKSFYKKYVYLEQSQSQSVTPSMTRRKMREKKMAAEMK